MNLIIMNEVINIMIMDDVMNGAIMMKIVINNVCM